MLLSWTIASLVAGAVLTGTAVAEGDRYPAKTQDDYVQACMRGFDTSSENCACAIHVIAGLVSHEDYQIAEELASITHFPKDNPHYNAIARALRLAQVEAELKCF